MSESFAVSHQQGLRHKGSSGSSRILIGCRFHRSVFPMMEQFTKVGKRNWLIVGQTDPSRHHPDQH
jgi:hypothetical protein